MIPVLAALLVGAGALAPAVQSDGDGDGDPTRPLLDRGTRYVPKPPGTVEKHKFYFGPYTVPPGHDSNRVDLELPVQNGFILSIEPGMRRATDGSEPSHQEAHIHHAHWFALDPGNEEDNYTGGNTEWIFGNGDEETKADIAARSAADPKGPIYGQYVGAAAPQIMIYMLHNKTPRPLVTYIVLDVTFKHGTIEQLNRIRPHHDLSGALFGRTYTVKREPRGDGIYESSKDHPKGPIEWTSTVEGTIIGTGGHLHPGGKRVVIENMGSKSRPCPNDGRGYGGTLLVNSDALFRNAPYSEDFQMEVTNPAWRAPVRKGDRIRITGIYENRDHAWYDVMTHAGLYVDEQQKPRGACRPYLVGPAARDTVRRRHVHQRIHVHRVVHNHGGRRWVHRIRHVHRTVHTHRVPRIDVTAGVPNRPFGHHADLFCGRRWGGPPCEPPFRAQEPGPFTNSVSIANFLYLPGDRGLSGEAGKPPRVKQGQSLTFVNEDQQAGIRHTVTTCRWPCNGRYVANYPFADGAWDSGTMGHDAVDGGSPNPTSSTPPDLKPGRYAYFCRIHPWMRGEFRVEK